MRSQESDEISKDFHAFALYCLWHSTSYWDAIKQLKRQFSQLSTNDIREVYKRAKQLDSCITEILFKIDEKDLAGDAGPEYRAVLSVLKQKCPGLSETAYKLAANKTMYLYFK
ncbi:MAG: hypothetical protein ACE5LB_13950 [Acidiferrobacterales bacterium]